MFNSRDQISQQLRLAVENNEQETVARLLENKDISQQPDEKGDTPLHIAARNGNPEIVRLLLKSNADRTSKNSKGFTPILMALKFHTGQWQEVVKEFALYPDKDDEGYYSIAITNLAAVGSLDEIILALLSAGTKPHHFAVYNGSHKPYSEMDWVVQYGNLKLFQSFLNHNYNPYTTECRKMPKKEDNLFLDHSAFSLALELKQDDIVNACLEMKGAQVLVIKDFIRQLEKYSKETIFGHEDRARSLVEDLKKTIKGNSCHFADAVSMITKANNVYKKGAAITISKKLPRYTQPTKNQNKDGYNIIIESCEKVFRLLLLKQVAITEDTFQDQDSKPTIVIKEKPHSPLKAKGIFALPAVPKPLLTDDDDDSELLNNPEPVKRVEIGNGKTRWR